MCQTKHSPWLKEVHFLAGFQLPGIWVSTALLFWMNKRFFLTSIFLFFMDWWTLVHSTTRYFILKVLHRDKTFSLQYIDPVQHLISLPTVLTWNQKGWGWLTAYHAIAYWPEGHSGAQSIEELPWATQTMGTDQNLLLPSPANQSNYWVIWLVLNPKLFELQLQINDFGHCETFI